MGQIGDAADLPLISVVIPSFNQARYLERTLKSVIDQEYPRLELMVFDAGSTDGSREIIERYAGNFSYWQSQPDGGQTAAINQGWKRSLGEVVAWLNSDDAYLPGTLAFVGTWFRDHPETGLLYGRCQVVDGDGRERGIVGSEYRRSTMLLSHQPIPQPATFVRRGVLEAVGYLEETLDYVMDYEYFLRVAATHRPQFVPRTLALATTHPAAKTIAGSGSMATERQAVRRRYARGLEIPAVMAQPIARRLFRALPASARDVLRRFRPTRLIDDRSGSSKTRDQPR